MVSELKNGISASDINAQYDEKAKRLLSNKIILAHIMVKTVDEFQGMDPKDVVQHIEGDPFISTVPIEPGLTNKAETGDGQRIVCMNTENGEINEGLVRFDIIFYARMRDGISQIIINLEAQKDEPADYGILNRAVFYASRMISSQKERDFVNMNYNDIRRVFSIWICMNMNQNAMDYVHLTNDRLAGSYHWKGRLDLLNIVLIGIADELPEHNDTYELHRLLSALLSAELPADERLALIETEYNIPTDDRIRKDVSTMCNLSQGIFEKGEARGKAIGKAIAEAHFIKNMHEKGYALEQIADVTGKNIDEIKAIIKEKEAAFV